MGWKRKFKVEDFPGFRVIPSFPSYVISESGEVKSLISGLTKKSFVSCWGYTSIGLQNEDGKTRNRQVHILVAEAFIGPRPEGMFVCHNDGDKTNPHLSNLRYDTPKANTADRIVHGTKLAGERIHNAKLTWSAVDSIRSRYKRIRGRITNAPELAKEFGVTIQTIHAVAKGRQWTDSKMGAG